LSQWRAIRSRVRVTILGALTCFAVACGDDSTSPSAGGSLFRLATVNSVAVPYVSPPSASIPFFTIPDGQLLLRPDETFTLSIEGLLVFVDGTYTRTNDELQLTVPNGEPGMAASVLTAPLTRDSIRIDIVQPPLALVFRASALPSASIRAATYVLTEANGRSNQPVILGDTVVQGTRYVYRVEFDTLWVRDGLFFKQHRHESATAYRAKGDSLRDEYEGISFGSYTSNANWLVLRRSFVPLSSQVPVDSLAVALETLTRTTRLRTGDRVERYTRQR